MVGVVEMSGVWMELDSKHVLFLVRFQNLLHDLFFDHIQIPNIVQDSLENLCHSIHLQGICLDLPNDLCHCFGFQEW